MEHNQTNFIQVYGENSDIQWKAKKIILAGTSWTDHLLQKTKLHLPHIELICKKNAKLADLIVEIEESLTVHGTSSDVLVIMGLFGNLVKCKQEEGKPKLYFDEDIDLVCLIKLIILCNLRWKQKYAHLSIIWTLPPVPDFTLFNGRSCEKEYGLFHDALTALKHMLTAKLSTIHIFELNKVLFHESSYDICIAMLEKSSRPYLLDNEMTEHGCLPSEKFANRFWPMLKAYISSCKECFVIALRKIPVTVSILFLKDFITSVEGEAEIKEKEEGTYEIRVARRLSAELLVHEFNRSNVDGSNFDAILYGSPDPTINLPPSQIRLVNQLYLKAYHNWKSTLTTPTINQFPKENVSFSSKGNKFTESTNEWPLGTTNINKKRSLEIGLDLLSAKKHSTGVNGKEPFKKLDETKRDPSILSKEFRQERQQLLQEHNKEFTVFEEIPEAHPEYEEHYQLFTDEYQRTQPSNMDGDEEEKWMIYWRRTLSSLKAAAWKKKSFALQKKLGLNLSEKKPEYIPQAKQPHISTNSHIEKQNKDFENNFSVKGTLEILNEIKDKLGPVGPAVNAIVSAVREKGSDTIEAFRIIADPENALIFDMVLTKVASLKSLYPAAAATFDLVINWTKQLVELATKATENNTKESFIDREFIAGASFGKVRNATVTLNKASSMKISILGHSYVDDLEQLGNERFSLGNCVFDIKYSFIRGATFETFLENPSLLNQVRCQQPDFLIIILGSNELKSNIAPSDIYSNCKQFFQLLRNLFPTTFLISAQAELCFNREVDVTEVFETRRSNFNCFLKRRLKCKDCLLQVQGPGRLDNPENYKDEFHLNHLGLNKYFGYIKGTVDYCFMNCEKKRAIPDCN